MFKYFEYVWYFIGGSWVIFVAAVLLAIFAPVPWYQIRKPVYHEAMMNVAKQIGFSADEAILEGNETIDCSTFLPCPCYQFIVFPTEQSLFGFQQQLDTSGLTSSHPRMDEGEDELFDYLWKTNDIILKANGIEVTWETFRAQDKKFSSFRWVYFDQYQWKTHAIEFFGIGESNLSLELFDKPFSGNFVVIDTEMGYYPSWACKSEAHVTKKQ
jgi:hypothetical protein